MAVALGTQMVGARHGCYVVLYFRGLADSVLRQADTFGWWPVTLLNARRSYNTPFEVFARSKSTKYFSNFGQSVGLTNKADIDSILEAAKGQIYNSPRFGIHVPALEQLVAYDSLASMP